MTDKPSQATLFGSRRPQQRWIAAAERRASARARFDGLPKDERAAIWARIDRLLLREAKWTRAKTMEDNPHSYCRRRDWLRDEDFVWFVTMLREGGIGDREKFPDAPGGRWYDVLNRDGRKFWVMGWPINYSNGTWCTVIINKKPQEPGDR
jgi:hypothetical protein